MICLRNSISASLRSWVNGYSRMPVASRVLLWVSILALPVLFTAYAVVVPVCLQYSLPTPQIEECESGFQSAKGVVPDSLATLLKEEEYLRNRLALGKSDSIYLVIDCNAEIAGLELRGCRVRNCPINSIRLGARIRRSGPAALANWIAAPFFVQREWSTIPKMPIKIKKAPRDSIQASKVNLEPRPVEKEDVHFKLFCARDLVIDVEQIQPTSSKGILRAIAAGVKYYADLLHATASDIHHGRLPRQEAIIHLKLDQGDARAIYRALPANGMVVLRP